MAKLTLEQIDELYRNKTEYVVKYNQNGKECSLPF